MSDQHMTPEERIETFRRIKRNHQCEKINLGQKRRILIDAMTANAVVTVYDALNEENRAKFTGLDMVKMAKIAWKLIK